MSQSAAVLAGAAVVHVNLPAAESEVLPGVLWGAVDAFPTPAYWTYQVMARRICGTSPRYRLGTTLAEEVSACLLGGHGIPAEVGVAAFRRLQGLGVLSSTPSESKLLDLLSQPIDLNGRPIRYRFAGQKARYLSCALSLLSAERPPEHNGRGLRDWLLQIPGVGYKTASWIARNWLDADDVAILDIHILRAGALSRFFDDRLTVERDYVELEAQFLRFAAAIGVKASELDAVMWLEMMSSPRSVAQLMGGSRTGVRPTRRQDQDEAVHALPRRAADKGSSNPRQARLIE